MQQVNSAAARPEDRLLIERFSQALTAKLFPKGYQARLNLEDKKAESWDLMTSLWHKLEIELEMLGTFYAKSAAAENSEKDPVYEFVADCIDALFNHLAEAQPTFSSAGRLARRSSRDVDQALNAVSSIKMCDRIFKSTMQNEEVALYLNKEQTSSLAKICQLSDKLESQLKEMQALLRMEKWLRAIQEYHHAQNPELLIVMLKSLDQQTLEFMLQNLQALQSAQVQFDAYLGINQDSKKTIPSASTNLFFSMGMNQFYEKAKANYDRALTEREKLLTALDGLLAGAKCWHGPSLLMAGQIVATHAELDSPYAFIYLIAAYALSSNEGQKQQIRHLIFTTLPRDLLRQQTKAALHGNVVIDPLEELRNSVLRVARFLNKYFETFLARLSPAKVLELGELYLQIHQALYSVIEQRHLSEEQEYLETATLMLIDAYTAATEQLAKNRIKRTILDLIKSVPDLTLWRDEVGADCLHLLIEELGLSQQEKTSLLSHIHSSACSTAVSYRSPSSSMPSTE
jgi:hypothetical protein